MALRVLDGTPTLEAQVAESGRRVRVIPGRVLMLNATAALANLTIQALPRRHYAGAGVYPFALGPAGLNPARGNFTYRELHCLFGMVEKCRESRYFTLF